MIEVDGNAVDPREIAAVTSIMSDMSGYNSASCWFLIHLKGGVASLRIGRSRSADSSSSQRAAIAAMSADLKKIRDLLLERTARSDPDEDVRARTAA